MTADRKRRVVFERRAGTYHAVVEVSSEWTSFLCGLAPDPSEDRGIYLHGPERDLAVPTCIECVDMINRHGSVAAAVRAIRGGETDG